MLEHGHCKEYLSQFSDYIDGELSPELCASLEAHLRDCENCRVVVNTLRKTIDLYHTFPQEDSLPENVRSRLFARLDLDDSASEEWNAR
jgi:anti-sigma factor RsiW